eukprot:1161718-Pelagomonas_calceolata.AAC.7
MQNHNVIIDMQSHSVIFVMQSHNVIFVTQNHNVVFVMQNHNVIFVTQSHTRIIGWPGDICEHPTLNPPAAAEYFGVGCRRATSRLLLCRRLGWRFSRRLGRRATELLATLACFGAADSCRVLGGDASHQVGRGEVLRWVRSVHAWWCLQGSNGVMREA